jgi:hypothetical protein
MPGIPAGAPAAPLGSGLSATTHSVVNNIPAIEAAFSRAIRVNFSWVNNTGSNQVFVNFQYGH